MANVPFPGISSGGMRNECTLPGCRIQRSLDVVDEPVWSNDGPFGITQRTADSNAAPVRQWSCACASEQCIS